MGDVVSFTARGKLSPTDRVVRAYEIADRVGAELSDGRAGSGEQILACALSIRLAAVLGPKEAGDFLINMAMRARESGGGGAA